MKKNLLSIICLLVTITSLISCTKETTNNTNATLGANGSGAFTWVEGNAGVGTPIVCDSAYASTQYKTIFVFKGATTSRYFYEINLTALSAATYSFTTTANALAYIKPGQTNFGTATAGSLVITASANNKLSGNGVITMPSIGDRLYVTITDLPIRP